MKTDLAYKLLGIDKSANFNLAQKAYRKLVQKYHPDKQDGNEEKFKLIKEAFGTLSPLLSTVSSKVIIITLEEAFTGCTKELDNKEFTIPPGVYPNTTIGMIPVEGGLQAVTVLITSESWAPRWGEDGYPAGDLARDIKVSPFTMMTGGWINIQTIESVRKVYIAPGFQANHWVKVAQAGYWKDQESLERGDAYLRIIPYIRELKEYSRDELNDFARQITDLL
jgi:DnaJ-class molecular chaperone